MTRWRLGHTHAEWRAWATGLCALGGLATFRPGSATTWALFAVLLVLPTLAERLPRSAALLAYGAAALTHYIVAGSGRWNHATLGLAALAMLLSAFYAWHRKDIAGAAFVAIALPLLVVWQSLVGAGWTVSAEELTRLAVAVGLALAVWCARPLARAPTPGAHDASTRPASPLTPSDSARAAAWHGVALCAVAAAVVLGEGVTLAAGLVLALGAVWRWRVIWAAVLATPSWRHPVAAMGLWLGAGALAWLVGGEGVLALRELGRMLPLLLAPLCFASALALPRRVRARAESAFLWVLAASAALGVVQFVGNIGPDHPLLVPFSLFSAKAQTLVPGSSDHAVAGGFYLHRLKLADVLLVGLGAALAKLVFAATSRARRLLLLLSLSLFGVAMALTFARAALLGAAAGLAVMALLMRPRWRVVMAVAMVLALGLCLALPSTRERLTTLSQRGVMADRALLWSQATDLIAAYPLGMGLGNYPTRVRETYGRVPPHTYIPPHHYAHGLVLTAWAETGPVGLLAFVWLGLTLAKTAWRQARRARAPAAALWFVLAAVWTVGTSHDVLYHKPITAALAVMCALWLAELALGAAPDESLE